MPPCRRFLLPGGSCGMKLKDYNICVNVFLYSPNTTWNPLRICFDSRPYIFRDTVLNLISIILFDHQPE